MGSSTLKTVSNIDILGVNFSSSGKYDDFINNRIQKCKRSMFALSGIGMSYPGLDTLNKVNLFKSICRPTLMYGVDCLNISKNNLKDIQSTQGFIMKHVCGLSKRAHHSDILKALDIDNASVLINNSMKCLFKRLCSTDSPTRNICTHFIYLYITENILIPGSLIERIVRSGASPLLLLNGLSSHHNVPNDGLVDTLRALLLCENYVKPWSNEYYLVKLLTRTFL